MFGFRKKETKSNIDYIIVGLGNPGDKYEMTRHNAGFMAVDLLGSKYNCRIKKLKFKALYGDCVIENKKVLLVKPQTFMNNSGETVRDIAAFYKIPFEKIIIIFDDISLDVGRIRIRQKGSDGGHNGMKSIIYLTASDAFPRIKIGIGAKPHPDYNLADWVLSTFKKDEIKMLETAVINAAGAAVLMVCGKTDSAMNEFNR